MMASYATYGEFQQVLPAGKLIAKETHDPTLVDLTTPDNRVDIWDDGLCKGFTVVQLVPKTHKTSLGIINYNEEIRSTFGC